MIATPATASDMARPRPSDIRVLIVDNDRAHAEAVAESLERVGYDCAVATSGMEGLGGSSTNRSTSSSPI